jgi:GAF domain-containing protein
MRRARGGDGRHHRAVEQRADLGEVVQYTVERVGAEVGADAGILLLLGEGEWVGLAGYGRNADARGMRSPYERFTLGVEALKSDEPVLLVDAASDERVRRDVVSGHDLGKLLVVPLRAFGQDMGVIVLNRPIGAEPLTREQLRFVSAVAGHAAVAIDNARLLSELENKRHDLSLIVESSLSFASSLDLADVLQTVVMRLVEVLQVDECDITSSRRGETIRRAASHGSSTRESIGMRFVVAEYDVTAEAVATGRSHRRRPRRPRLNPRERADMVADGHRSQMSVPLKVRTRSSASSISTTGASRASSPREGRPRLRHRAVRRHRHRQRACSVPNTGRRVACS